jgi:hypothetical protein
MADLIHDGFKRIATLTYTLKGEVGLIDVDEDIRLEVTPEGMADVSIDTPFDVATGELKVAIAHNGSAMNGVFVDVIPDVDLTEEGVHAFGHRLEVDMAPPLGVDAVTAVLGEEVPIAA